MTLVNVQGVRKSRKKDKMCARNWRPFGDAMNSVKELLRFRDLNVEVIEPNKTLMITHSDMDGTKCAELLKEKFPKAQYFYVDAKIKTTISAPPSKGNRARSMSMESRVFSDHCFLVRDAPHVVQ